MSAAVTFWTKCWEADYQRVLARGGARVQWERCAFRFDHRGVIINNVNDRSLVETAKGSAYLMMDIDEAIYAEDHAAHALDRYRLTKDDLGRGYVYSICEMIEPWLTKTPYYLHFASDVVLSGVFFSWIRRAVEILEQDPAIAVVNPLWNHRIEEARAEAVEERGDHVVGYGFSDQCYLVRTADFRGDILRETNPASERYPIYGGELFEKRVDAWMRNHGRLRATLFSASYKHPAYPRAR